MILTLIARGYGCVIAGRLERIQDHQDLLKVHNELAKDMNSTPLFLLSC